MALHRGIQSAIFYYLSCAPCSDARYRKRRKQEAQRDRAHRDELEAQLPGFYRHPSPSSTNPYWHAEIALGPASRRTKRKTTAPDSQRRLRTSAPQSSGGSNIGSNLSLTPTDERHDSKWNWKPYQRRDEELWPSAVSIDRTRTTQADRSASDAILSRPQPARVQHHYESARNPSLNHLHPPIAPKVRSREDVAWMLQPPPVAEVMSGKERAPRSRSNSGSSRPSAKSASAPLSQQLSARLINRRLKAGETPASAATRESSSRNGPQHPKAGQPHDRGSELPPLTCTRSSESMRRPRAKEKKRPAPLHLPETASNSSLSAATVVRHPSLARLEAGETTQDPNARPPPLPREAAATRPQLLTILSNTLPPEHTAARTEEFYTPLEAAPPLHHEQENDEPNTSPPAPKPPPCTNTSLTALHPLPPTHPPAPLDPMLEARLRPPRPKASEQAESLTVVDTLPLSPQAFDSWYTPDFEWVHEHTRREVRERWSMEF